MNILIFEYITGGGMLGEPLPASLVKEGELMLNAITDDFAKIENIQVSALKDCRLASSEQNIHEYIVSTELNVEQIIENIAHEIDALLIIAPESDNILTDLCRKYSQREFLLLNSSLDSISLTSDKLKTYKFLQIHNIAQVPSFSLEDISSIQADKIMIKPRSGVGCENLHLLDQADDPDKYINQSEKKNYLAQPYLTGLNASLSLLCWEGECILLCANKQILAKENNYFELNQCVVNSLQREQFIGFSNQLVKALPGLRGYVGIDILITEDETFLVEINPRLTTSYAGLHSALGCNPAELILKTFMNKRLPNIELKSGSSVIVDVREERVA